MLIIHSCSIIMISKINMRDLKKNAKTILINLTHKWIAFSDNFN